MFIIDDESTGLTFFGRTKIDLKLGLMLRRWARIALLLLFRLRLLFLVVLVVGIFSVLGSSESPIDITESDFFSKRLDESLAGMVDGVLTGFGLACCGSSVLLWFVLIKLQVLVVDVIGRDLELLYGWFRSELIT